MNEIYLVKIGKLYFKENIFLKETILTPNILEAKIFVDYDFAKSAVDEIGVGEVETFSK